MMSAPNNPSEATEGDGSSGDPAATPTRERPTRRRVTKTELHHAEVLEKLGIEGRFPKVQRRERREFTSDEDAKLLQGFTIVRHLPSLPVVVFSLTNGNSTVPRGVGYKTIPLYTLIIVEVPTFAIGMPLSSPC